MNESKDIFVVSDLHIADGGPRDDFEARDTRVRFKEFLDFVEQHNGELIILGDLFDFWQVGMGRVLRSRRKLIKRLGAMGAVYVVGNHDGDLEGFIGTDMLRGELFERMCGPFFREIAGRRFKFMHGHEVDPYNKSDYPGWGRILSIIAGMYEDRHGSPMLAGGVSVEDLLRHFGQTMLAFWRLGSAKIRRKLKAGEGPAGPVSELTPAQNPSRATEMLARYTRDREQGGYDVLITGHTHRAGRAGEWYYNSGCWVGKARDILWIRDGGVGVYKWRAGELEADDRTLE